MLERGPSLLATGRKAFILMRHSDALPACRGQRIPDARDAVTSDDADQASVAVLSMNEEGRLQASRPSVVGRRGPYVKSTCRSNQIMRS